MRLLLRGKPVVLSVRAVMPMPARPIDLIQRTDHGPQGDPVRSVTMYVHSRAGARCCGRCSSAADHLERVGRNWAGVENDERAEAG
jgi:hypothetical protein